MSPWLLLLVIIACALVAITFAFLLFPNWFFTNTASNMNEVRAALVKADKNKTYRVGIYVEGDLSEVFLAMLKNSLQKYKLPVVFAPLHRPAGRNLLFEGEWFNQIAFPDEKAVDLVVVMELQESPPELADKQKVCHGIRAAFYQSNGACANHISPTNHSTPLVQLGYEMAIEIARVLRLVVTRPQPTPKFTGNPNVWPFDDNEENFTLPQNTPR